MNKSIARLITCLLLVFSWFFPGFFLVFSWFGTANASGACGPDTWQSIPQVLPDPDYISVNDEDLVYTQQVVKRNGVPVHTWATALGNAASSYFSLQAILSEWDAKLSNAKNAFWQHFAKTGKVDQALKNEYTYWLHKRELWGHVRTTFRFEMKQQLGGEAAGVLDILFGGNRPNTFKLPYVFESVRVPSISGPAADYLSNSEYKEHFGRLAQYGFLTETNCFSQKSIDKITEEQLFPFNSPQAVKALIDKIKIWADGDTKKIDDLYAYIKNAKEDYAEVLKGGGSRISISEDILINYMNGKDPIPALVKHRFDMFTEWSEVFQWVDLQGRYYGHGTVAILRFKDLSPRAIDKIDLGTMTTPELLSCLKQNWEVIRAYIFDNINQPRAMNLLERPSQQQMQLQLDFGQIAVLGCASPEGFDDERVQQLLAYHKLI